MQMWRKRGTTQKRYILVNIEAVLTTKPWGAAERLLLWVSFIYVTMQSSRSETHLTVHCTNYRYSIYLSSAANKGSVLCEKRNLIILYLAFHCFLFLFARVCPLLADVQVSLFSGQVARNRWVGRVGVTWCIQRVTWSLHLLDGLLHLPHLLLHLPTHTANPDRHKPF